MRPPITHLLALLAALISSNAKAADPQDINVFKCKNNSGQTLYQGTPCPKDTTRKDSWTIDLTPPAPPRTTNTQTRGTAHKIAVRPGGGYYTTGNVNSTPATFQIDTGADITTIPRETAYRANLTCASNIESKTANGKTTMCRTTIRELKFGNFTINNVVAHIAPNLETPLLGMNVLTLFHIEQENGVMTITYKH